MKKNIFTLLLIAFCFSATAQNKVTKRDLKKLYKTMSGYFNSEQQSVNDTDYFNITLRMKPINIDNDGYWLYVEQAMFKAQHKPYRQRVYHVYIADDSTIVSKVYELKNPAQYINGWKNDDSLKAITKDSLVDRQGCGIYLRKKEKNVFSGSTPGKECLSTLRGATYATSEVTIYKDKVISWDRGFDKDDKHVWGATKGGYIFIKQEKF